MMEIDELSYNVFYLLLRNEYRKKYDYALTKCWTLCVPHGDSLRDLKITREFIDDHILRPISNAQFASTDEKETHFYKIDNFEIKLINDNDSQDEYKVKILSIEKGYNKEYQPYNIIIIDKPIHRKYRIVGEKSHNNKLELNRNITCYKEGIKFLNELPDEKSCPIDQLTNDIENINVSHCENVDEIKQTVHKLICNYWANTIRKQTLDIQRDARFQKLLSISLEIFVMHHMHDDIYLLLSKFFTQQDLSIKSKIDQLIDIGVSPDQLGVAESLAVSMPSAMVELATLDNNKGPFEKLMCLKGTIDFIVAEIKGAIADVESKTDILNENDVNLKSCALDTDNLIPLLLYVIVKCRCQKLYTDLFYVENFTWSISPHDGLSYTLVTFRAALSLLEEININNLPKRSEKVKLNLNMSDLLQVAQIIEEETPLDRQLRGVIICLGNMLGKSTETF